MIRWGLAKADELGLPAYLEASPAGYKLYARLGFQDVERLVFDLSKWGGQGESVVVLMIRPSPTS
jgi:hypothetical protein